eukprot:GHVS01035372.1.p1 GENE.GHVS01035372.1~~GHVS01035372.1.p1  ORF type:complete len:515 (+),score=90.73 GHVS01035372.1:110-1654(+)
MTTELVKAAAEEEAGGRMAERSKPTEENISRRRRRATRPSRLLAVMGLRALGCLLSCSGHDSLRQTLVPPQAVSVAEPDYLLNPPARTLTEAAAAASPLLSSPPLLSMIPTIQPDMTPVGGNERMLGDGDTDVYVFVDSKERLMKHWQPKSVEVACSGSMYYLAFFPIDTADDTAYTDWKGIVGSSKKEQFRVIVATDKEENVSTVMQQAADVFATKANKSNAFGCIPLKKGNRFSTATGWDTVFVGMFGKAIKSEGITVAQPPLDEALWCAYLTAPVKDYVPLELSIDGGKDNGDIVAWGINTWKNVKTTGLTPVGYHLRRWVFQSFVDVTLSKGGADEEQRMLEAVEELKKKLLSGVLVSIQGFKGAKKEVDEQKVEKAKEKKEWLAMASMIHSMNTKYGVDPYERERLATSLKVLEFAANRYVCGAPGAPGDRQDITSRHTVWMAPAANVKTLLPTDVVIQFQHTNQWTPEHGEIAYIKVDGMDVLVLNPSRLQIVAMDTVKVLFHPKEEE